jgi:hypothetical protein
MTALIIAAAAIIPAGAYLRWGIRPMVAGYQVGRQAERIAARRGIQPE